MATIRSRLGWRRRARARFRSAVQMDETTSALVSSDPKKANLKLLWIACGTEDDLVSANRRFISELHAKGFPVTQIETPGMHTWLVWRDNLVHFLPLLFTR